METSWTSGFRLKNDERSVINPLSLIPVLLLLGVSACGPVPLKVNFAFELPENQKIAVKAKYLVNPKLCDTLFSKHTMGGGVRGLATGEALCAGIDHLMHTAFMDATRVATEQTLIATNEVLIIPKLLAIDMTIPGDLSGKDEETLIKMQWTAIDAKGNILWTDTIKGEAKRFCMTPGCRQENMKQAIQDQFQKAFKSMMRHEWWKPFT